MFKRILVPLDGSELAERALTLARDLAKEQGAELILLRVASGVDISSGQAFGGLVSSEAYNVAITEERKVASEYLVKTASEIENLDLRVRWVVEVGDPASSIVGYGERDQVDLIVMSTHGRSGISRWVYGSVADRVLRGGTVPVLLVRAKPPSQRREAINQHSSAG